MGGEKRVQPNYKNYSESSEMNNDPSEKSYSIDIKEVDSRSVHDAESISKNILSTSLSIDEINWRHERYKRVNEPRIRKVVCGISRGNTISLTDEALLRSHNVKAVVMMSFQSRFVVRDWREEIICISREHVKRLSCERSLKYDFLFQLSDVCDFIDRYAVRRSYMFPGIMEPFEHSQEATVLVTTYGDDYEATMLIYAYMMRNYKMSLKSMIDYIHLEGFEDPDILYIDEECMSILNLWCHIDYEVWEDKAKRIPKDILIDISRRYVTIFELARKALKSILKAEDYLRLT